MILDNPIQIIELKFNFLNFLISLIALMLLFQAELRRKFGPNFAIYF